MQKHIPQGPWPLIARLGKTRVVLASLVSRRTASAEGAGSSRGEQRLALKRRRAQTISASKSLGHDHTCSGQACGRQRPTGTANLRLHLLQLHKVAETHGRLVGPAAGARNQLYISYKPTTEATARTQNRIIITGTLRNSETHTDEKRSVQRTITIH